jgi:ubiquinone/menaquinone biosynthesis C-methylase UbiE
MIGQESGKGLLRRLFEKFLWLDSYYVHPVFSKWIIAEMDLDKEDRVLDIGCGSGWLSREIARVVSGGEVVGLDVSEEFIRKTKQVKEKQRLKNHKGPIFKVADVVNIPYPDDYFNYAVSLASFSFWSDPEKGLQEIKRVLKPEGKLCIADVYKEGPLSFRVSIKINNALFAYQENIYSSQEYRDFFQRAGFRDVLQKQRGGVLLTTGTKKQAA